MLATDMPNSRNPRRRKTVWLAPLFLAITLPLSAQDMRPLSSALAKSITASGRKTVAVIDFTDLQGNVTELGRFLAEEFSVDLLADANAFEVIDRTHLKSILQEHKLATTGLIDPQTARKLGQLAGVDTLVTGTIIPLGDSVRLTAKVLDTSTAKMIGASTADIPKTRAIEELLAKGISSSGTSTSETVSPNPPGSGPRTTSAPPNFETESYRVTVQSVQRRGSDVSIALMFECFSEQGTNLNPQIGAIVGVGAFVGGVAARQRPSQGGCTTVQWGGLYLLDENGERWNLDPAGTTSGGARAAIGAIVGGPGSGPGSSLTSWPGVALVPGTKLKVVLLFSAEGQRTGTQFTLAATESSPKSGREIVLRGLKQR